MITALLFVVLFLYVFFGLLLLGNLITFPRSKKKYEPTVSVIVAVRNEEAHLKACMKSLIQLDYPQEKLDIVLVDDASTDETVALARDLGVSRAELLRRAVAALLRRDG